MSARSYFDDVWQRCDLFASLHGFLAARATAALKPDELLRAEWAARVSALDLFIHELIAENLVAIFTGARPGCPGFTRMQVSSETLLRIRDAATDRERVNAYDLEVRSKLSRVTYQFPNDIADGIRMISGCQLWNDVAVKCGATSSTSKEEAKGIRDQLSAIVERRNKIVHEGDLQPNIPRVPWPIDRGDVSDVSLFIERIVGAIEAVVA